MSLCVLNDAGVGLRYDINWGVAYFDIDGRGSL